MTTSGDAAGYALAYDIGREAIDEQVRLLRELRDRAGVLQSAAAVAGALGSGLVFSGDRAAGLGLAGVLGAVIAVAGFVGVVVMTVLIWSPTEATVVQDAGVVIGSYVEGDPPLALPEIHRELALWMGRHAELNRETIAVPLRWYGLGLVALLVQVVGIVIVMGDVANG